MSKFSFPQIAKEFHRLFHTSFYPFYSIKLHIATGRILPDLGLLDDYLKKMHKDFVDGISMKEIIRMKYGEEAEEFIQNLISE